jgi:hypothetical protein
MTAKRPTSFAQNLSFGRAGDPVYLRVRKVPAVPMNLLRTRRSQDGRSACSARSRALKRDATHVRDTAESNPLGLAVGGLAVGFLVGTLLPQSRVENEQMGELSDRMVDAAKDTASEAVERGKQVAQEAVGAAVDTAKESGSEQGEELTSTLKERAQDQSPTTAA